MIGLAALGSLGACQDHHWVDADKMGEVQMAERPAAAPEEPVVTEGRPGVPYEGTGMLSGNAPTQEEAPDATAGDGHFHGVIVAGTIDIDPDAEAKAKPGMSLYVIARPVTGGPPIAAIRATAVSFPFAFRLAEENVMMSPPQPGQALSVEARLDSDGDPMTKDMEKDLFASSDDEVIVGEEEVSLTLRSGT